jgi:hypothetical protein
MNKFEDRSPSVGDVVNVCKENVIKDGDREHNKHYSSKSKDKTQCCIQRGNFLPPLLNSNNYQDNLEEVSLWPSSSQGEYLLQRLLPKPPLGTSIGLTFATIWRFRI